MSSNPAEGRGLDRESIAHWLESYRIPEDVPKELRGAIVPPGGLGRERADRLAVRTLHTLLLRSPVDSVVVVEEDEHGEAGDYAVDDQPHRELDGVELDLQLRDRLLEAFPNDTVRTRREPTARTVRLARCLGHLAPGISLISVRRRLEASMSGPDFGAALGRELATDKVAVVGISALTSYGPSRSFVPAGVGPGGEEWLVENDQRMLLRIRALDAEGVLTEAKAQRNAEQPHAIAAAIASARPRDGWSGHLVEYTHTEVDEPVFTDAVGIAGVVF